MSKETKTRRTTKKATDIRAAIASDRVFPNAVYKMDNIKSTLAAELGIPVDYVGSGIDVYLRADPAWKHNGLANRHSRWSKNGAPFEEPAVASTREKAAVGSPAMVTALHSRLDSLFNEMQLIRDTLNIAMPRIVSTYDAVKKLADPLSN